MASYRIDLDRIAAMSKKARNVTRVDRHDAYANLIFDLAYLYGKIQKVPGLSKDQLGEVFTTMLDVLALRDRKVWSTNGREFFKLALDTANQGRRGLDEFVRVNFDRIEDLRINN